MEVTDTGLFGHAENNSGSFLPMMVKLAGYFMAIEGKRSGGTVHATYSS